MLVRTWGVQVTGWLHLGLLMATWQNMIWIFGMVNEELWKCDETIFRRSQKTPSGKLEGRIGMSVLFQVAAEQYLLQKHFVNQKSCCESWMQNAEDKSAFDRRGKLITLVMLVLEGVAVALLDAMIFNNVLWLSRVILLRMRFR